MARLNSNQRNNFHASMLVVLMMLSPTMAQHTETNDHHDHHDHYAGGFGTPFIRTHDNGGMHVDEGYEDGAEWRYTVNGEANTRQYSEPALPNRPQNEPGGHEDIWEYLEPVHPHPTEDKPAGVAADFGGNSETIFSNLNEDVPNGFMYEEMEEFKPRDCPGIEVSFKKHEETFQWKKIAKKNIFSFSAYYDERVEVGGPLVRVLSNGHQEKFHPEVTPLYCLLIFPARKAAVSMLAFYRSFYESRAFPNEHTGHWIECPVPELIPGRQSDLPVNPNVPIAVTVVPDPCGPEPTFWLPVHTRKVRKDPEPRIALCTPVLYNADDWVQIAEWIILHKFLGYSTVYFYVLPRAPRMDKVHQIRNAFEKLHLEGDAIVGGIRVVTVWWEVIGECYYFCQHAVINECLYRAGLDHDYVTVADKDEVLIPLKHNTMHELISELESCKTAAYMFQHIMFDETRAEYLTLNTIQALSGVDPSELNTIDITQFQPWTLTWKWHMSEPYPPRKIRSKTLYNVNRTVSADIHFSFELVTPYKEVLVAPHDGVVYHYKKRAPEKWLQDVAYEHGSRVEKYQAQLLREMIRLFKHLQ